MLADVIKTSSYRKPVICAVALHVGLFVLLIGSFYFHSHPKEVTDLPSTIQANLVSISSVAPPLPKMVTPPAKLLETPAPSMTATPNLLKAKPIAIAPPKPVIKKNFPHAQQKTLDEAIMQEESKMQKSPIKKVDKTAEDLMNAQMEEESVSQARQTTQAKARSQAVQAEVDQYSALIKQQIQQNWIIPQHVENLSCLIEVQTAPGGMVTQVRLLKSSGNEALDRSALAAINKASPLPVPKDSAAFNAFRRFTITVKPEGGTLEISE